MYRDYCDKELTLHYLLSYKIDFNKLSKNMLVQMLNYIRIYVQTHEEQFKNQDEFYTNYSRTHGKDYYDNL